MKPHFDQVTRRDGYTPGQQYLESTVRTASPARLRLMLIERAIEVSGRLAENWHAGIDLGSNAHSLKLLDLLNELLSGVVGGKTDGENAICRTVADLYVFLAKHLVAAEPSSDAGSIDEIHTVLEIEAETWRAVCANEMSPGVAPAASNVSAGGLNLQG